MCCNNETCENCRDCDGDDEDIKNHPLNSTNEEFLTFNIFDQAVELTTNTYVVGVASDASSTLDEVIAENPTLAEKLFEVQTAIANITNRTIHSSHIAYDAITTLISINEFAESDES